MALLPVCIVIILCHVFILNSASKMDGLQRGDFAANDQTLENVVYAGVKSETEGNDIENRSPRDSPLWLRILNRLGKARELFVTSGKYPIQSMGSKTSNRYLAPPTLLAKFRRNNKKSSSSGGDDPKTDSDLYRTAKHKKGGSLSINGALSSLADMLVAEGQRRDHSDAMRLRQRLLVAGKR